MLEANRLLGEEGCPGCERLALLADRLQTAIILAHAWIDRNTSLTKHILEIELRESDRIEADGAPLSEAERAEMLASIRVAMENVPEGRPVQSLHICAREMRHIADQLDALTCDLLGRLSGG